MFDFLLLRKRGIHAKTHTAHTPVRCYSGARCEQEIANYPLSLDRGIMFGTTQAGLDFRLRNRLQDYILGCEIRLQDWILGCSNSY